MFELALASFELTSKDLSFTKDKTILKDFFNRVIAAPLFPKTRSKRDGITNEENANEVLIDFRIQLGNTKFLVSLDKLAENQVKCR